MMYSYVEAYKLIKSQTASHKLFVHFHKISLYCNLFIKRTRKRRGISKGCENLISYVYMRTTRRHEPKPCSLSSKFDEQLKQKRTASRLKKKNDLWVMLCVIWNVPIDVSSWQYSAVLFYTWGGGRGGNWYCFRVILDEGLLHARKSRNCGSVYSSAGGRRSEVLLSSECLYLAIKYIAAMSYIAG